MTDDPKRARWQRRKDDEASFEEIVPTLYAIAAEQYGCKCTWCLWRVFRVRSGLSDPGELAAELVEDFEHGSTT